MNQVNLIMIGRVKETLAFYNRDFLPRNHCFCTLLRYAYARKHDLSCSDVIAVLLGEEVQGASFAVGTIRFPRMIAGIFAGFAFGVAGYVFQTMLRNPLANPNVIGITAGSSAAAVFCIIVLHASNAVVSIASVIGGLATVIRYFSIIKRVFFFNWSINISRYWNSSYVKCCHFLFITHWPANTIFLLQ